MPRNLTALALPALLALTAVIVITNGGPKSTGDETFWDRNRRALTELAAAAAISAGILALGASAKDKRPRRRVS